MSGTKSHPILLTVFLAVAPVSLSAQGAPFYLDCPLCADHGGTARTGPFATIEECEAKRASVVQSTLPSRCEGIGAIPGWKQYVYPRDGFAISAQVEPGFSEAAGSVYGVNFENGAQFLVFVFEPKLSRRGSPLMFNAELLDSFNASATSTKVVNVSGTDGIELEWLSGERHGRVQTFVVRDVTYQLISKAPLGVAFPPVMDAMFRSFRFLPTTP